MSALRAALVRMRSLVRRSAVEHELDEEMRYHLARETEQLIAGGMHPADARTEARRAFGNVEFLKEESRDARGIPVAEHVVRDLAYALRLTRKHPAFAAVVVASLALGLGATTAVFNLTYNVLFAPLALPHPEQLAALVRVGDGGRDAAFSPNEYRALRETPGIGTLSAVRTASQIAVVFGETREYVNVHFVDGAFFPMVGLRPLRGRLINHDDDARQATLAVLSEPFAERLFPADSAVVGRTIIIRGTPFTVVGVTPRSYRGLEYPGWFTIAIPLSTAPLLARAGSRVDGRGVQLGLADGRANDRRTLRIMGRLTADRAAASAALAVAFARCCAPGQAIGAGARERLEVVDIRRGMPGGKDDFRDEVGTVLLVLLAGMGLVVTVVCCNIASLLVVRASARQREIVLRLTLGASRGRLVSQLVLETLPLALAGGVLGVIVAAWASAALIRGVPEWDSYVDLLAFRPGPAVLVFVVAVTVVSAVAFAAYPAVRATRGMLGHALRADARAGRSREQRTMARAVVVAQVALTVVLVTAASLLLVTLRNLGRADGGFATEGVLLASLEARGTTYEERGVGPLHEEILANVRGVPGIRAAAMATMLPMFGGTIGSFDVEVPGYEAAEGQQPSAAMNATAPSYFAAMAIPLQAGRDFTPDDATRTEPVVIVSDAFARRYFGQGEALGRSFRARVGGDSLTTVRIVGVAADVKYFDLRSGPEPLVYLPLGQSTRNWTNLQIVLRTGGDPLTAASALRRAVDAAAPGMRVLRVSEMRSRLEVAMSVHRLATRLAVFAGAMALVLSVVGLYGVVAYGVARRTTELGVRIALGARAPAIVWLVAREMVRVVAVGVVVGLPLSFAANRVLASQLFGVGASDPLVMACSVVVIASVALMAAAVPARRAVRIDPSIALVAD